MQARPVGVTLLVILAAFAFATAVYHTLQMLHILPLNLSSVLGEHRFFTFDLLGAVVWGLLASVYLWVLHGLWNMAPKAWLYVVALAALNLIVALLSILGRSTWRAMLPALVVNILVLLACRRPAVRAAFGRT